MRSSPIIGCGRCRAGYEVSAWHGIGAPQGMPVNIIDRLNRAINIMLADSTAKARVWTPPQRGDLVAKPFWRAIGAQEANETEIVGDQGGS